MFFGANCANFSFRFFLLSFYPGRDKIADIMLSRILPSCSVQVNESVILSSSVWCHCSIRSTFWFSTSNIFAIITYKNYFVDERINPKLYIYYGNCVSLAALKVILHPDLTIWSTGRWISSIPGSVFFATAIWILVPKL